MSRTILSPAFALSAFLSACSSGQTFQPTTGSSGTTGGAGTTTGASLGTVSTVVSFLQNESCSGAPASLAIDFSGDLLTVAGMMLLSVQPDGGITEVLPFQLGVTAVAASSAGTYLTEGMPVALYTEQSFNQTFLSGGSTVCLDGSAGEDGGIGFASGRAIAADAEANVYLADWSQTEAGCTRIRRVDFEGNSTTIAGTGAPGYMNGPGSTAQFFEPSGVAVDRLRNVYVSDSFNNRIRMVGPDGTTSTVAGNGTAAFDDGAGPPDTPTSATFNLPTGIAVDSSGNIFVADTNNNSIRMITADGGTTTLAGNGKAGLVNGTLGKGGTTEFSFPISVAVDSKDNVYVADYGNCAIRVITLPGSP
jgi:hypothetical protein